MNYRIKLLLISALALIIAMTISYWTAYSIHRFRQDKAKKFLLFAIGGILLAACEVYVTMFKTGGLVACILGLIVGFMPFFHVENKETEDQIKVTEREKKLREEKLAEAKARREEKNREKKQ